MRFTICDLRLSVKRIRGLSIRGDGLFPCDIFFGQSNGAFRLFGSAAVPNGEALAGFEEVEPDFDLIAVKWQVGW